MGTVAMVEALSRTARLDPDRPALTVGDETLTYCELDRRTNQLARALAARGVRTGSYVTVALPNSIGFVETCLATLKLGAVIQPVSSRLSHRERQEIVDLADSVVVVGASAGEHDGRVCIPDPREIAVDESDDPLPLLVSQPWRATTSGGSTGRPKLIVGEPPAVVDDEKPDYLLPADDVVLIPGPLFHGAPFLIGITALFHGNHVILEARFDAAETLRLIEQHPVRYLLLVPTMMHRIWRLEPAVLGVDVSSIQTVLHLGAACPAWLKQHWIDWLGPERVFELYGASDAPNRTFISGVDWLTHPGSVGRTAPGEFRITDEDGTTLPCGELGEIWMRPPPGQPPRSFVVGAESRIVDGWTTVGDIGWMDEDGFLYVADRRVDMINTGGENVYPAEVESAIERHPGVRSSAVVGAPDDELGWRVHAVVEVDEGVTEEDLRTFLVDHLVPYKRPRTYSLVHEPIRDDAGKVRKATLLDPSTPGATR